MQTEINNGLSDDFDAFLPDDRGPMTGNAAKAGDANDMDGDRPTEGRVAKAIEERTARVPSDIYLWTAAAALCGSLALQIIGMKRRSGVEDSQRPATMPTFVGMWVPSLLLLGVYNKVVKVAGSDRSS